MQRHLGLWMGLALLVGAFLPVSASGQEEAVPSGLLSPKLFGKVPFKMDLLAGSSVSFYAKATLHWFTGTSRLVSGEFIADANGPRAEAENTVRVPVEDLHTGIKLRDGLMRELLRVDLHPAITYRVKSFELKEHSHAIGEYRLVVTGDLTIRGVTREERFDVLLKVFKQKTLITGQADLDVRRYQIEMPVFLGLITIRPVVTVKWSLEAELEFLPQLMTLESSPPA